MHANKHGIHNARPEWPLGALASSERSFRIIMLFSQRVSLVFDALTISEMKLDEYDGVHNEAMTC